MNISPPKHEPQQWIKILILAGSIPFIGFAFVALLVVRLADKSILAGQNFVAALDALNTYGMLIAAFLAGSYWGNIIRSRADTNTENQESHPPNFDKKILLISNALILILWVSAIWVPPSWLPLLLVGFFSLLLWVDHLLLKYHALPQDYYRWRIIITLIVILTLAISASVALQL